MGCVTCMGLDEECVQHLNLITSNEETTCVT
jgi:hypothetical protein